MNTENDLSVLDTDAYKLGFEGMSLEDVVWSQHQIILNLKKRIAELENELRGHLKSIPVNY